MATFTVTNINDSGAGSLRQAILDANAAPGADTIAFASATFTDATHDTIRLNDQLFINDDVTITGTGINSLIISGDKNANSVNDEGDVRVFWVNQGNVNLSNLTIANGRARGGNGGDGSLGGGGAAGVGGGLFVKSGNVTIDSVAFTGNQAIGGNGGNSVGVYTSGGGGGGFSSHGSYQGGEGGGNGGGFLDSLGGKGGRAFDGSNSNPYSNPFDFSLTDGASGVFGTGGGGGGNSGVFRLYSSPQYSEALMHGLGGNGGDFGGGGGGGGNGGYGGGAGGGLGLPGFGGGATVGITRSRSYSQRVGVGNSSEGGGPVGAGGGGAGFGGAVFIDAGTVTLSNSTFASNLAAGGNGGSRNPDNENDSSGQPGQGKGGAIFVREGAILKVAPSTLRFSSNTAANAAGTPTDGNNLFSTGTIATFTPAPTPASTPGLKFRNLKIKRQGNNTLITAGGDPLALLKGVKFNLISAADFTQV